MDDTPYDLKRIGAELVSTANDLEKSPGEVLAELFPYIFEASRRMSTRAISAWLKDHHDVEISQSTISRALRHPDKYWELFAESIESTARIAADALDLTIEDTLFKDEVFDTLSYRFKESCPELAGITRDDCMTVLDRIMEAFETLRTGWFSLSPQSRSYCGKYFLKADASEAEHVGTVTAET